MFVYPENFDASSRARCNFLRAGLMSTSCTHAIEFMGQVGRRAGHLRITDRENIECLTQIPSGS